MYGWTNTRSEQQHEWGISCCGEAIGQGILRLVLDDTRLGADINFISAFVLVPLKHLGKDLRDVRTFCGFVGKTLNSFPI